MPIEILDREIISLLISMGLTEREARLYYVLFSKGENRVREIANLSGIPEPHVYSLLKSMHSKGLVEILQGDVRKYRAIPLDLVVDNLIGEKERVLISLKNEGHKIAQRIKVNKKGIYVEELKPIHGKRNMEKKVMEMIQGAKRDILCVTSTPALLDYKKHLPSLKLLRASGINLRILTPFDGEKVKPLIDAGVEIKFLAQKNILKKLIVDEEETLLGLSCEEPEKHWDFGIWTNHKEIVKRARQAFEERWDKAKDAQDSLQPNI